MVARHDPLDKASVFDEGTVDIAVETYTACFAVLRVGGALGRRDLLRLGVELEVLRSIDTVVLDLTALTAAHPTVLEALTEFADGGDVRVLPPAEPLRGAVESRARRDARPARGGPIRTAEPPMPQRERQSDREARATRRRVATRLGDLHAGHRKARVGG